MPESRAGRQYSFDSIARSRAYTIRDVPGELSSAVDPDSASSMGMAHAELGRLLPHVMRDASMLVALYQSRTHDQ